LIADAFSSDAVNDSDDEDRLAQEGVDGRAVNETTRLIEHAVENDENGDAANAAVVDEGEHGNVIVPTTRPRVFWGGSRCHAKKISRVIV
jgi:hypothetical protein